MSMMYGKRRVVLQSHLGNFRVVICGSRPWSNPETGGHGAGGLYFPIGYWYKAEGLYYADVKSHEQFFQSVNRYDLGCKGLGGVRSKKALRQLVMAHFQSQDQQEVA